MFDIVVPLTRTRLVPYLIAGPLLVLTLLSLAPASLNGDFSVLAGAGCQSNGKALQLFDPASGQPYANNQIPVGQFEVARVTAELKPLTGVTVIVDGPVDPTVAVAAVALKASY